MRKKEQIVCTVMAILAVVVTFGFIIFGITHENEKNPDKTLPPYSSQTADGNGSDESVKMTDSGIPPISSTDKENTKQESNRPDVDVGDMTRNPDAEVVSSRIEYGTKEIYQNAE